ncbi:hypothetical protein ACCO45_013587 [Purpureocillium lilacinum]|uniref:Uncharacterized protein n=1 Tax=Purpureocillium lilacinum TaxID=33203 RepID=A0ACC4D6H1_PURLI
MHEAGLMDAVGRISWLRILQASVQVCSIRRRAPNAQTQTQPAEEQQRPQVRTAGRPRSGGFLFGKFGSAPVGRGRQLFSRGSLPRGGVECLAAHRVGCRRRGSFNWVPTAGCIGCMMLGRPTSAEQIPSIPGEERRRAGFEPSTGSANNPTLCGQDRMWRLTCIEHASGSGATKKQSSGSSPASVGSQWRGASEDGVAETQTSDRNLQPARTLKSIQ